VAMWKMAYVCLKSCQRLANASVALPAFSLLGTHFWLPMSCRLEKYPELVENTIVLLVVKGLRTFHTVGVEVFPKLSLFSRSQCVTMI
jgi:hypothetical protein